MFNPYLIIIKDKESILGVHELKYDYTQIDYSVEVLNNAGESIFQGKPSGNNFINLDISLGTVSINYKECVSNKPIYSETLDLNKFNNYSGSNGDSSVNDLIDKVYYEMDNPKGSTEEIEFHTMMLKMSAFDEKARYYVENKVKQILLKENKLTDEQINALSNKIYADFYGMGILQELDDDGDVSEIMVNAYIYPKFSCDIYYIKTNQGKKKYEKTFDSLDELINIYSRAIAFSKKELNNLENAMIEATRANGDRVNIIIPEASESYVLNIRKFSNFAPTRENMLSMGTINEEIDSLMKILVDGKANIGIGGEMGSGKTTYINYLLSYTKPIERKVIISSVKEIDVHRVLKGHDIVFLNVDDEKGFSFSRLIRASLRTTSDRIIVPEARGGEFKQVYEANLKTKGNMFTAHALNDSSFLDVCADMYMEDSQSDVTFIKNKIAKSIDFIIIMGVIENQIRIKSISEVLLDENSQFKGLNKLFYWDFGDEFNNETGYKRTSNRLSPGMKKRLFEEGVPYSLLKDI